MLRPLLLGLAVSAVSFAGVFTYDAASGYLPSNNPSPNVFSYAVFADTNWGVSGGVLTMTTAPGEGIWFGNHPTYNTVPWQLGGPSDGNYVRIDARVLESSIEWQTYLFDSSYAAGWEFNPTNFRYWYAGNEATQSIDGTQFHSYEMWLKNGTVTYAVDGARVFQGAAIGASTSQFLVIGDGSASGNSGTGSMQLRTAYVATGSDFVEAPASTPEPGTFVLAGGCVLALAGFRRFRR